MISQRDLCKRLFFFFLVHETIEIESESRANHSFLQCPVAMGYGGSRMELQLKCL